MKCKHCDGDGVIVDVEYGHAGKYGCKYCDGKGVVEPLTNEEWIKSATTEQLEEELLAWWVDGADTYTQFGLFQWEIDEAKEKITKWLKEKHHAN